MSLNRIVLSGRLTRDPERKETATGVAMATTAIAVDHDIKNSEGKHDTDFFNLVLFRQPAEFALTYLKKGREVNVEGRCQVRKYTNQSGVEKTSVEVMVDRIYGVGAKPEEAREEEPDPWADE